MISLRNKFLFIHVPKTGGNSIQDCLKDYSEDRTVVSEGSPDGGQRFEVRSDRYRTWKHSTLSEYKAALEPTLYRSLYKFSVLRNPWDRLISFYFSPHRGRKEWDRAKFVRLVNHGRTLDHFIVAESVVERAKRALRLSRSAGPERLVRDIDFLIRFERMNEDFSLVCQKIGVPCVSLSRRNGSDRNHYSMYYDPELVEMVRAKFSVEIEYGKYEFEKA